MVLPPGETEAGSAGEQPDRGIARPTVCQGRISEAAPDPRWWLGGLLLPSPLATRVHALNTPRASLPGLLRRSRGAARGCLCCRAIGPSCRPALARLLGPVAGDVQLHDHAVMHQPVDRR